MKVVPRFALEMEIKSAIASRSDVEKSNAGEDREHGKEWRTRRRWRIRNRKRKGRTMCDDPTRKSRDSSLPRVDHVPMRYGSSGW